MAEYQGQMMEVIAKEIVIELIQKSSKGSEDLLTFSCEAYDQVYKQLVETYKDRK